MNEVFSQEPFSDYRKAVEKYLTSHALADFRKCPLLYHKKQTGEIQDKDSTAFQVGRALHTLVLEGREVYQATYAVGGPINPKTGAVYGANTKAYKAWKEEQGKEVLTDAQAALVEDMAYSVGQHVKAQELIQEALPERVCRTDYLQVPCQIRLDGVLPEAKIFFDLKTCDDLTFFEYDARRFGYVYQMAFYRAILKAVTGETFRAYLIAVEKKEPFRAGFWMLPGVTLDNAASENKAAIRRLLKCQAEGNWPTNYEEMRVLTLDF